MPLAKTLLAPAAAIALAALPAAASAESFDGEYLALQAGVGIVKTTGESRISGTIDISTTRPVIVGVAGYRGPLGQNSPIVLGVEGDFGATIDELDTRFGLSAIAGYKLNPTTLAYLRGGYASRGGLPTGSNDSSQSGWMAGGGVEFAAFGDINLRLDYRYADLGSSSDIIGDVRNHKSHELGVGAVFDF